MNRGTGNGSNPVEQENNTEIRTDLEKGLTFLYATCWNIFYMYQASNVTTILKHWGTKQSKLSSTFFLLNYFLSNHGHEGIVYSAHISHSS